MALATLLIVCLAGYGFLPPVRQARHNQALFRAIHANDAAAAGRALADGADPNAANTAPSLYEQKNPAWRRAWNSLRGVPHSRPDGGPALYEAIEGWYDPATSAWVSPPENVTLVRALLDAGANANARGDGGTPVLASAAGSGRQGTVNLLLGRAADVNACDAFGYTALMRAATCGDPATVRTLVDRGAQVNQGNGTWATALFSAASFYPAVSAQRRADVVRLLLSHGADTRRKNDGGQTPLDHARRERVFHPNDRSLDRAIVLLERCR